MPAPVPLRLRYCTSFDDDHSTGLRCPRRCLLRSSGNHDRPTRLRCPRQCRFSFSCCTTVDHDHSTGRRCPRRCLLRSSGNHDRPTRLRCPRRCRLAFATVRPSTTTTRRGSNARAGSCSNSRPRQSSDRLGNARYPRWRRRAHARHPRRHRHVDRSTEPVCSIDCPAAPSFMGCSTPGPGGRTRSCRATISFCRSCNCALATRAASALSRHSFVLRADPRHLRREGCVQLLCERSGP